MGVKCGIDLGTTFSSIAWYDQDRQQVDVVDLRCADGQRTVRSAVYYPGPGEPPVVGESAYNQRVPHPDRVLLAMKRSMGTAFRSQPIDGVEYTPQMVGASILRALADDAAAFLGEPVESVIVTVPAYFGDNERRATEEAVEQAGLELIQLMPEPHAAALAYSVDSICEILDRYLLVYDLGGGTFDVTLIHATAAGQAGDEVKVGIETICKAGNANLGGLNFDQALAELVADRALQQHGVDVFEDDSNEAVLMVNAEKAKRALGPHESTSVLADLAGHAVEVTRAEFEDVTRDLLNSTEDLLEVVFNEAQAACGVTRDQIDVILCGGATRMPMVKRMLTGVLGRDPIEHRNPDLLVSVGAAYRAYTIGGAAVPLAVPPAPDPDDPDAPQGPKQRTNVHITDQMVDVSRLAIGVEVVRTQPDGTPGYFISEVLPKGTRYDGSSRSRTFATAEDDSTDIEVVLYEGDSELPSECAELGAVVISGIPEGRPAGSPVEVTLSFTPSGVLVGTARDVTADIVVEIEIDRSK